MHIKKVNFIFVIILSLYTTVYSQTGNSGSVTGFVRDSVKNRPLEFVNLLLQNNADSSKFAGTTTDHNGKFEFKAVQFGEYVIKISYLGYKNKITRPFTIDSKNKKVNAGTILLSDTTVTLEEVLISAQKSLYNNTIDKKVYNVSQDIMSKSGSASDLLQNVPSVQVDIDGGVSLRGSSNVLIMINGKTSPLMGRSQATVLQGIPANTIDKIEVITNPSAKYRPDGTSGIINIVLKKNSDTGLNGTVNGNVGLSSRYNGGFHLNYNNGGFNIFGGYNLRKNNRNRSNTDDRQQFTRSSGIINYNENFIAHFEPLSHFITLGVDYSYDNFNSLGASGNYFYNSFTRNDYSNRIYSNSSGNVTENYNRNRYDNEFEKESDYTFYYEHKFPKDEHKIRMEFTGSHAPEQENNHFTNIYYYPNIPTQYDNTLIKQTEDRNQLSIDYSNPLSKTTRLEAGYEGYFNKNDFDFHAEYFDPARQQFIVNIGETNRFIYNENIHAVYTTYEHTIGSFEFLEGLRVEQVFAKANLVTTDSSFTKNYFNLYPTLHIAYKLGELTKLQLSYSRRVRRPESDDINPFPEYSDPRNIHAGNPNLLPEYIHSLELGFNYQNDKFSFLPSLYYRYTSNRFTVVRRLLNDTTSLSTESNLSNDQSAGLEFIFSANEGQIFSTNVSTDVFYNQIDASNLGYGNKKSIISWSGHLTFDLNLTKTLMLQLNSNYRSVRLTPQGEFQPGYVVNLGAREEFFQGRLSLLLTVFNLFNTLKREIKVNSSQLTEHILGRGDSRIIYLGMSYNFGAHSKKSKGTELKYDGN